MVLLANPRPRKMAFGTPSKIKKSVQIAGTDELEKYVLLTNGHDGNTAVQVLLTPVRVVCQNTLSLALHRAGSVPKIYHQTGMRRKLADAFVEIEKVVRAYDNLEATFNEMAKAQVSQDRLSDYLKAVFPDPTPPAKSRKSPERYERELAEVHRNRSGSADLFESGKGNASPRVQGTLWAAYNGVVEHLDHRCPYSSRRDRFAKLIFGEVARVKTSALLAAQELAAKWGNN
jgi:phage/plasmid-like protein (TIGR03299 family)